MPKVRMNVSIHTDGETTITGQWYGNADDPFAALFIGDTTIYAYEKDFDHFANELTRALVMIEHAKRKASHAKAMQTAEAICKEVEAMADDLTALDAGK